jgi:hypothetical protein
MFTEKDTAAEREVLSAADWYLLREVISQSVPRFILGRSETSRMLMNFVIGRTLRYHRFSASIKVSQFLEGIPKAGAPPIPRTQSALWKARRLLMGSRVLEFIPYRNTFIQAGIYRLNLPGMLNELIKMLPVGHEEHLRDIRNRIVGFWEKSGYRGGPLTMGKKFEKEEREALEQNRAAVERNYQKARKKNDLTTLWILDYMKACCDEAGHSFYDQWTGREFRSAKNWLKYCDTHSADPKKILREVCELWPYFKAGALVTVYGKKITLPDSVSFSKFYLFRDDICSWIEAHRDSPSRYKIGGIEVIDLRAEVKRRQMLMDAERRKK